MKNWKIWQIALFVALCILLNYGGMLLADRFDLPLWLDAYGTVLCAYVGGPVCGIIVGVAGNLICGMKNGTSYVYALTSAALALIVGIASKKHRLKTLFDTVSLAALTAFAAASSPCR